MEGLSHIFSNWFVTVIVMVHAVMLLGFFIFILGPNRRGARIALTVALFGVCGGMIALASGRELVKMFAGL
jgi:hypothetical protein